ERGPGPLHTLLYDRRVENRLEEAGQALHDTTAALSKMTSRAADAASEVAASARALREIVAEVRAGRGTVGGLVYDPMIYENLRTITGGVKRSALLRALVRYAFRRGEEATPPREELERVRGTDQSVPR